ncbi:MAG: hypothetical protein NZM28_04640 [Fimbriimonadales bacterium]|nr:hypothetical protein [Fimbriimonadales bacterium]
MRVVLPEWLVPDDATWKAYLDDQERLRLLVAHGDPELHERIDWERGVVFRDKELAKIAPKSVTGVQIVDKLVQVYLRDGTEEWLLIHIEVQSTPQSDFEERIFAYFVAIWLHYRRRVVSLVILADENPNWRPSRYELATGKCRVSFEFPTLKLMDLDERALVEAGDSASLILAAFLRAMRTRGDADLRYQARVELMALAMERGYNEDEVRDILRFLEGAMKLPTDLEDLYEKMLDEYRSKPSGVVLLSSIERKAIQRGLLRGYRRGRRRGEQVGREGGREEGLREGREEGLQQGLQQAIIANLRELYGGAPDEIVHMLQQVKQPELLQELLTYSLRAGSLQAFQQRLQSVLDSNPA